MSFPSVICISSKPIKRCTMISNSIIRFDNSTLSSVDQNAILHALQETIHKFNLDGKTSIQKINENELQVTGLEGLPLHNFTLRCEQLGKQVDYEKRTVICVQ